MGGVLPHGITSETSIETNSPSFQVIATFGGMGLQSALDQLFVEQEVKAKTTTLSHHGGCLTFVDAKKAVLLVDLTDAVKGSAVKDPPLAFRGSGGGQGLNLQPLFWLNYLFTTTTTYWFLYVPLVLSPPIKHPSLASIRRKERDTRYDGINRSRESPSKP